VDASASHENISGIIVQSLALVSQLRDEPVDDAELDKAVRRAIWALFTYLDDPHAMSAWYGEQALYRTPVPIEERARQIASIATADLQRVAGRVFTADNLHATAVGVLSASERRTIERIVGRFR